VSVETYWCFQTTGTVRWQCCVVGSARRFGAHAGRKWAGYIVAAARLQLVREVIIGEAANCWYWIYSHGQKSGFFRPDRCTDSRQNRQDWRISGSFIQSAILFHQLCPSVCLSVRPMSVRITTKFSRITHMVNHISTGHPIPQYKGRASVPRNLGVLF